MRSSGTQSGKDRPPKVASAAAAGTAEWTVPGPDSYLLPRFRVCRYRLRLRAVDCVVLPSGRVGVVLRGAFGQAFRRLVCHAPDAECSLCPLAGACPYARVFAPSPPADAERLRRLSDIPRPFVFAPEAGVAGEHPPGECFAFDLTLIGDAVDFLPYFVVAFRALGDEGIGPGRGRFVLEEVSAAASGHEPVYVAGDAVVRLVRPVEHPGAQPASGPVERLTLRFLSPTALREGKGLVEAPTFAQVAKRLRDRASATHYFWLFGESRAA